MPTSSLQAQLLQRLLSRPSPRCLHHHTTTRNTIQLASWIPVPLHLSQRFSTTPRPRQNAPPSSSPVAPLTAPPEPSQLPQPPPPPKATRPRPRWFSAILFLLLGAVAGTSVRVLISPPPPPPPGSRSDEVMKEDLRRLAEKLPIVKHLLAETGCMFPSSSTPLLKAKN